MTPNETFICVLTAALLIAGLVASRQWLKSKTDQRKMEVHKEETKMYLDAQSALLSAQDGILAHDERMAKILSEAMRQQPILEDIEAAAEPARQSIVRAVGEERGGTVHGIGIAPRFAAEINAQRRQQSVAETLTGIFRVSKVDTTAPEGFRVTFANIENGEEISASLEDAILSERHQEKIQKAEWTKQPVKVVFKVRRLRNRYVEATIINVDEIPIAPRAAQ